LEELFVPNRPDRANAFSIFAILIGLAGFALASVAVIVAANNDGGGPSGSSGGGGSAEMIHINAGLSEFKITLESNEIPTGAMLMVSNNGSAPHNLAVKGTSLTTPDLNAGETAMLDISSLAPGDYQFYCSIAGHEAAGMIIDVTISDSATAPSGSGGGGHAGHGSGMTKEEADRLDDLMMASMEAFPAETEGRGNQKAEPTSVDADGTLVFDLVAELIDWEVEPGKIVEAWAYNGQVPGPWFDFEVGDKVRFNLENKTPLGTDVHWHGITLPNEMDGVAPYTQPLVKSGEGFVYEFTLVEPMIAMYHAHAHSQVSVPNGMFGVITVGDRGLPLGKTVSGVTIPDEIDLVQEIPMVLNDAGVIGYSLNGKSFPATDPIVVDRGDWFLVHYYNEGLQIHPMHLHGTRQLVFSKDGIPLDQPYWVDVLNVAPGERYSILANPQDPGVWVYHCHILTHVERDEGMFGMVTAMIVN